MRRLLVFQHVPFEPLGTLNPLFKRHGFRIRYVNFGRHPEARPRTEGYHGLVILGGPMSAADPERHPHLATETALIREAIEREVPVLGICLGAQLLARALGGEVRAARRKEIGWHEVARTPAAVDDPLFSHFGERETLFQWHEDTFAIPRGAVRLAGSATCPNQAFRYRRNVYGLQFHLEVDEPLIERWLRVHAHRHELLSAGGSVDPDRVRQETAARIARAMRLAERTFGAFVRLFGPVRRHRTLAHY